MGINEAMEGLMEALSITGRIWDEAESEEEDAIDLREEWMFAEVLQAVSHSMANGEDAYNIGRDTMADLLSEEDV